MTPELWAVTPVKFRNGSCFAPILTDTSHSGSFFGIWQQSFIFLSAAARRPGLQQNTTLPSPASAPNTLSLPCGECQAQNVCSAQQVPSCRPRRAPESERERARQPETSWSLQPKTDQDGSGFMGLGLTSYLCSCRHSKIWSAELGYHLGTETGDSCATGSQTPAPKHRLP